MDAEKLLEKARKSISRFCVEECHAYCCRKGYLVLNAVETAALFNKPMPEIEKDLRIRKINDNTYSLFLGNYDFPCPALDRDFTCRMHSSAERSMTCRNFPIFLVGEKTVKFSSRCLAVKSNKFYPYISKLIAMGYRVIEGDIDSEFYNVMK